MGQMRRLAREVQAREDWPGDFWKWNMAGGDPVASGHDAASQEGPVSPYPGERGGDFLDEVRNRNVGNGRSGQRATWTGKREAQGHGDKVQD